MRNNKTYIIPTKKGFLFLSNGALIGLIGLVYSNNLILILSFIIISIFLISQYFTNYNLRGLSLTQLTPLERSEDEKQFFNITIENESNKTREQILLKLKSTCGVELIGVIGQIAPHQKKQLLVHTQGLKMGAYEIEKVSISTFYPLGLFYSWSYHLTPFRFYVYPVALGEEVLRPLGRDESKSGDPIPRPGSDEYFDQRQFADGDDPKRLNWKYYARQQEFLFKQYSLEAQDMFALSLTDLPARLSLLAKIQQVSKWAHQLFDSDQSWSFSLPGEKVLTGRGALHFHSTLKKLVDYHEQNN